MAGVDSRKILSGWGGVVRVAQAVTAPVWLDEVEKIFKTVGGPILAGGLRRSYGGTGLNPEGVLVEMAGLNRVISFDTESGILRAEAGASLSDLMRVTLPQGWFFATTPGTRYVTLGGAVANDVHGKNHHSAGTFGCSVRAIGLVRSDTQGVLVLRPGDALFAATVGGLGLTGVMAWVEVQLVKVPGVRMQVRRRAFGVWDEFWAMAEASKAEHTVAWVDGLHSEGRGIFEEAEWLAGPLPEAGGAEKKPRLTVPFMLPVTPLNRWTVMAFNALYYRMKQHKPKLEAMESFFYPLDGIGQWPRLYGSAGFYQYQCVLPTATMKQALPVLMAEIAASGQASFLAVLKTFGDKASPGMMSFPMAGATLALDFPNRGQETLALLARLDRVVVQAGGRLYAAKDARLPVEMFKAHENFAAFASLVDARMSSEFWERVKYDGA